MKEKFNKIVIIGVGNVGITVTHDLILNGYAKNYALIDVNQDLVQGQVWDLEDIKPLSHHKFDIKAGTYRDCADADVVIITAGRNQKKDETRLQLVQDNAKIMKSIIKEINNTNFNGFLIITSNPLDVMTYIAHKESKIASQKIIGSGTLLDSARFNLELDRNGDVWNNPRWIIGEHGDSSLSEVMSNSEKAKIEKAEIAVRQKAMKIIKNKGWTCFGIARAVGNIVEALLSNEKQVYPLSVYLKEQDLCISLPCKINKNGITDIDKSILENKDSKYQNKKFLNSCQSIKPIINKLEQI